MWLLATSCWVGRCFCSSPRTPPPSAQFTARANAWEFHFPLSPQFGGSFLGPGAELLMCHRPHSKPLLSSLVGGSRWGCLPIFLSIKSFR